MRSLASVCLLVALSCNRGTDRAQVWQPSDHQHTTEPGNQASSPVPEVAAATGQSAKQRDSEKNVVLASWSQNCAVCHGPTGRGDGPRAGATGAPDLTRADWLGRVTDDQIAAVIRRGRARMPGFNLPDSTIVALVRLVRDLGARDASAGPTRGDPSRRESGSARDPVSPEPAQGSNPSPVGQ